VAPGAPPEPLGLQRALGRLVPTLRLTEAECGARAPGSCLSAADFLDDPSEAGVRIPLSAGEESSEGTRHHTVCVGPTRTGSPIALGSHEDGAFRVRRGYSAELWQRHIEEPRKGVP
jgi:hypothetical protein